MEENNNVMNTEIVDNDEVDVYDLVPSDSEGEGSNGGAIYALFGGAIVAGITGAVIGGKKLISKWKDKRVERAFKILEEEGYEIRGSEPDVEDDEAQESEKKEESSKKK